MMTYPAYDSTRVRSQIARNTGLTCGPFWYVGEADNLTEAVVNEWLAGMIPEEGAVYVMHERVSGRRWLYEYHGGKWSGKEFVEPSADPF